ncbi:hypothetical protein LIER_14196 [Lithospermum erythrorhizon]|uniref:Uncharacterized protein n=1 Tax=Lithospermum erythrorhizon TaxID=34254 RepID=A0AAV3Q074_LITER
MANLDLGPQASYEASRLWIQVVHCFWVLSFLPSTLFLGFNFLLVFLQAASASRALGDGHTLLSQQTHTLHEALTREHLKVRAMEEELKELRTQVSNYPWDLALKDQELRMAEAEREAANQATLAAHREKDDLRRAYL